MSMCETCHAGCCRAFAVPITGADIMRIEMQRGIDFWSFVCRWADPSGSIARNQAPHFFFRDDPGTPYVICLLHAPSRDFPQSDKCVFLNELPPTPEHPLGVARCGVYEDRPSTCRAFPTRLNHTSELAILYDLPASGRPGGNPMYQLCPRPWETSDFDPVQQVQDLVVAQYEMTFFHALAQSWNEQPGLWRLFPEFLRLVYHSRVRPEFENLADEVTMQPEVIYPRIAA